jgi:hypothetical protein
VIIALSAFFFLDRRILQDDYHLSRYLSPLHTGENSIPKIYTLPIAVLLALTPNTIFAADDAASKSAEAAANKILAAMKEDGRDAACLASLQQASNLLDKSDDKTDVAVELRKKINNGYVFFAGRLSARVPADKLAIAVVAGKTRLSTIPTESRVYFMLGCHSAFVELFDRI